MLKNVYCKSYAFLLTTLIMALKIKCIIWLWKLLLDSKVIFVTPIPVPKDSQIMHWSKCLWHGTPDSKLNVSRFNRFPCLFLDKIRFLSHRPLFSFFFFYLIKWTFLWCCVWFFLSLFLFSPPYLCHSVPMKLIQFSTYTKHSDSAKPCLVCDNRLFVVCFFLINFALELKGEYSNGSVDHPKSSTCQAF